MGHSKFKLSLQTLLGQSQKEPQARGIYTTIPKPVLSYSLLPQVNNAIPSALESHSSEGLQRAPAKQACSRVPSSSTATAWVQQKCKPVTGAYLSGFGLGERSSSQGHHQPVRRGEKSRGKLQAVSQVLPHRPWDWRWMQCSAGRRMDDGWSVFPPGSHQRGTRACK